MTVSNATPPANTDTDTIAPRRVEVVSTHSDLPIASRVRLTSIPRTPLKPGQVRIGMLAMAINPADLLQLEGSYGTQPALPFVPGHEGVAVVLECAPDVSDLVWGDRVLPMGPAGCWADERVMSRRQLVSIPAGADVQQCAMLTANPATASVLLSHMRALQPGDWVLQNAANSAVGQCVRQIAQQRGLRVINVVRRSAATTPPSGNGMVWVVDAGDDAQSLRDKVSAATGGTPVQLALDAVGGSASQGLAQALSDGGLLVVYGLLSGQPCTVPAHDLVFRGLQVRGFWLASWFADTGNRQKTRSLYPDLVTMVQAGTLRMAVEAVYPLEQVHDALAHAARPMRSGKILLAGAWAGREVARPLSAA